MNARTNDPRRFTVPTAKEMRAAVESRDRTYDGCFLYGVLTTGVFCRPSCPSRRARPENLRFFADAEGAARAGFRPCRRCRPDALHGDAERLVAAARHIEAHADEPLTLAELSRHAGLSPERFRKAFREAFGVTPTAFRDAARVGRLKEALRNGAGVTDAILAAGFGSPGGGHGATRTLGMTPSAYRSGGAGETIRHAYRDSALGPLLLAATDRGVCFVQFGPDRDALLAALEQEFPRAERVRSDAEGAPELDRWIEALDAHLRRDAPRPDLPLDLRGTAFQLRVWRFLLSVPEGDVRSYGEVARAIGAPRAVRAVASACGANRVGVLVPCHRVLRGDGGLGGYRWGLERKRTLLELERGARAGTRS
jgi:AraC family transcriptional regulator of adaptative response/methylated-DNA-[protein]-cysteine methyltransferase